MPNEKFSYAQLVEYFACSAGYSVELMSLLPENDEKNAVIGKVYVSEDGRYIVRHTNGVINQGQLNQGQFNIHFNAEFLYNAENLKQKWIIEAILSITSEAGHTPTPNRGGIIQPLKDKNFLFTEKIAFSEDSFIHLKHPSSQQTTRHENYLHGWKFHISIDDSITRNEDIENGYSQNLARGWNIVKDILIKHGIHDAKVIKPGKNFSSDAERQQYGKQITIYQATDKRADDPIFWARVLSEIEFSLANANPIIQPDLNAKNFSKDRFFLNQDGVPSKYISYRNEFGIDSKKMAYVCLIKHFCTFSLEQQKQYWAFQDISLEKFVPDYFVFKGDWNSPVENIPKLLARDCVREEEVFSPEMIMNLCDLNEVQLTKSQKQALSNWDIRITQTENEFRQIEGNIQRIGELAGDSRKKIDKDKHFNSELIKKQKEINSLREQRLDWFQQVFSLNFSSENVFRYLNNFMTRKKNSLLKDNLDNLCENNEFVYSEYGFNDNIIPDPFDSLRLTKPASCTSYLSQLLCCISCCSCSCCPCSCADSKDNNILISENMRTSLLDNPLRYENPHENIETKEGFQNISQHNDYNETQFLFHPDSNVNHFQKKNYGATNYFKSDKEESDDKELIEKNKTLTSCLVKL